MSLKATPGIYTSQITNEREQLAGGRPVSPLTLLAQRVGAAIRVRTPDQPPPSNNAPSESCFTESARPTALSTGWSTPWLCRSSEKRLQHAHSQRQLDANGTGQFPAPGASRENNLLRLYQSLPGLHSNDAVGDSLQGETLGAGRPCVKEGARSRKVDKCGTVLFRVLQMYPSYMPDHQPTPACRSW